MPLPSRLSRAILAILEMPRMLPPFRLVADSMTVPGSAGAKVFFIHTGIFRLMTGWIVGG